MIYLTDQNINPTAGTYYVRKLTETNFSAMIHAGYAADQLKVYIEDDRHAHYLEGFLKFPLPDTPRFTVDRKAEFTMNLEPGDSVILFKIAPIEDTDETGFPIDTDTYRVLCVQYLLYGLGADAVALHLLHECPHDIMDFGDWVRTVIALANDYAAASVELQQEGADDAEV